MSPSSVSRCRTKKDRATGQRTCVRYYSSQKGIKQGYKTCPIKLLNAKFIDDLVRALVLEHLKSKHRTDLRSLDSERRDHCLREVIDKVVVALGTLTIGLRSAGLATCSAVAKEASLARDGKARGSRSAEGGPSFETLPTSAFAPAVHEDGDRIELVLSIRIKRHDGRRILVSPEGQDLFVNRAAGGQAVASPHIVRAIGLAFAWHHQLLDSRCTIEEVARNSGADTGRVRQLLHLTRLSPAILKAALTGQLRERIGVNDLQAAAKHLDWTLQGSSLQSL